MKGMLAFNLGIPRRRLFAALALAVVFVGGSAVPASAGPVTADVIYTYDAAAGTFQLYTFGDGPIHILAPTLSVDGQAPRTDALCSDRTWVSYGIETGDSKCTFSGVSALNLIVSTGTVRNDPSGFSTTTWQGTFKITCRKVGTSGCTGVKLARLRAV